MFEDGLGEIDAVDVIIIVFGFAATYVTLDILGVI